MFSSVLVANRAEIAVRIVRTLRRMGIRSVVTTSIPDRDGRAARLADAAVLLEGYSAAESYLDIDAVLAAAKREGCEAIHPGYGFLSERADFAERCAAEGIVFIGPPPAVLRGLGDKAAARMLVTEHHVPVVPGWDGDDSDETLAAEAARIGYPVMIKARGGGGGRGMREVTVPAELAGAIASARQEAVAAFGDPGLLLERLVTGAHHVEVQVLADRHGNAIHLGERDCSVQRRHQKLVEETPSPVVDDRLREQLTDSALRLARAIGYENAGTFEFLVGQPDAAGDRPFYFLEVNPRLQVEHPVTELVTGLDLVELQLRVAAGERLPISQKDVHFTGHAIEVRINAEDPREAFRPSAGRIADLRMGPGRFDAGFESGDTVPAQYDSLLGKLILSRATRPEAIAAAREALSSARITGLRSNIGLHRAILASETFASGEATVDWLGAALDSLLAENATPAGAWAAAAAVLAVDASGEPFAGTRWMGPGDSQVWLDDGEMTRRVSVRETASSMCTVVLDEDRLECSVQRPDSGTWTVLAGDGQATLDVRPEIGEPRAFRVSGARGTWVLALVPPPPLPRRTHAAAEGVSVVTAPLAGTIAGVRVTAGDEVAAGQVLATLDAMKMEHRVSATSEGTVTSVLVAPGDVVREGDVLFELD